MWVFVDFIFYVLCGSHCWLGGTEFSVNICVLLTESEMGSFRNWIWSFD